MAVKSATKKKLVEQGVAPEHAHLLATDRNMADLKALSIDQIAEILSLSVDDEAVKRASQLTQASGRRSRSGTSRRVSISTKAIEDDTIPLGSTRFNVLNHELVPHQELVPGPAIGQFGEAVGSALPAQFVADLCFLHQGGSTHHHADPRTHQPDDENQSGDASG